MTVSELIVQLQSQDQDLEVWLGDVKLQEDDVCWVENQDGEQAVRIARDYCLSV